MEKDAAGCPSLLMHYGLTNPGTSRTSPAAYPTHVRFGGGPTEKGRFDRYLAGGLPYLLTKSSTGVVSACTPLLSCAIRFS
jgi:hypothetical protein